MHRTLHQAPVCRVVGRTAVLMALLVWASATASAKGEFMDLSGSWSGSGRIVTSEGAESIRCRATYAVSDAGASVRQELVCASPSYKFNVNSTVADQDGQISGDWTETTRQVGGKLVGTQSGGRLQARIIGKTFGANLNMVISKDSQAVSITSQNGNMREVTVTLQRK